MKSAFGFMSLLALGLLTAGLLAVGGTGPVSRLPISAPFKDGFIVDYFSLALGVAVGLSLSGLSRIAWGDLPRRVLSWFFENRWSLRRAAWGAVFLGILIFY